MGEARVVGLVPANKATTVVLQIKEDGKSLSSKEKVLEGETYKISKFQKPSSSTLLLLYPGLS